MNSKSKASNLKKKRKIFGWLFLVSILIFFLSIVRLITSEGRPIPYATGIDISTTINQQEPPEPRAEQKHELEQKPQKREPQIPEVAEEIEYLEKTLDISTHDTAVIVSVISLLTSITSFVGFFSTTLLAWRKEKRESLSSELEMKKKKLELEKMRVELEKAKRNR